MLLQQDLNLINASVWYLNNSNRVVFAEGEVSLLPEQTNMRFSTMLKGALYGSFVSCTSSPKDNRAHSVR